MRCIRVRLEFFVVGFNAGLKIRKVEPCSAYCAACTAALGNALFYSVYGTDKVLEKMVGKK